MNTKSFVLLFCMVTSLHCFAERLVNTPDLISIEGKKLSENRKAIDRGDATLMPAYKQLITEAEKALKFGPVSVMEKVNFPPSGNKHDYMSLAPYHWPDPTKPDGLPYMRKDGQTNPEVKEYKDKDYMPQLCDKVFKLSLAWYFSGEVKYAEHAGKLLRVWFLDTATRMNPNLNYGQAIKGVNTGRGAGLIDARHFLKVMNASVLLQKSKYWSQADQKGMAQWFSDFLQWMETSKNGLDELDAPNNHGAWYDALRLSIALYTNDTEHAKKIVKNAQDRLDKQMNEEGKFPLEMERTTSLHYTVFVMDAFFNIAQMSEKIGVDLWNYTTPSQKSLRKGFQELLPYLAKKREWQGPQIKPFNYEEGFQLLATAYSKMSCKDCRKIMMSADPEKAKYSITNLIY